MKRFLILAILLIAGYTSAQDNPESYTTNYGLRKYAEGAHAGADSLNKNLDDIDTEIKNSRNASNITSGTISNSRLGSAVMIQGDNFDTTGIMRKTRQELVSGLKAFTNPSNTYLGQFIGDGSLLTNLPGISDTNHYHTVYNLDSAQLGFLNQRNTWTKRQLLSDSLRVTAIVNFDSLKVANRITANNITVNTDVQVDGDLNVDDDIVAQSISADGANITAIDAGNVQTGTLTDSRLSANVPLINASNAWTGTTNTFAKVKTTALYADPISISSTVIDGSLGNTFTQTLSGSRTYTFSNFTTGQIISVAITGSGGSTAASFTGVTWSGGSTPTGTATTAKTDVWTFIKIGSVIYGSVIQNF